MYKISYTIFFLCFFFALLCSFFHFFWCWYSEKVVNIYVLSCSWCTDIPGSFFHMFTFKMGFLFLAVTLDQYSSASLISFPYSLALC